MEENSKNKNSKERIAYGKKLPLLSFGETIAVIEEVGIKAGSQGSLDAMASIMGNSLSSSNFQSKIAHLKNLKLIELEKPRYLFTELGDKIAFPHSPNDRTDAVFEAFKNHDILEKIWDFHKGKRLPQIEYLSNYIEKSLGIPLQFKVMWAEYFIEAGKVAKILDEKEVGSYQVLLQPIIFKKKEEPLTKQNDLPTTPTTETQSEKPKDEFGIENVKWGIVTKKVISGNRQAIFAIPEQLSQQDIDSLRLVIKGIDVQLDGLKKFAEEEF